MGHVDVRETCIHTKQTSPSASNADHPNVHFVSSGYSRMRGGQTRRSGPKKASSVHEFPLGCEQFREPLARFVDPR